jgi:pyridoxine 5-phosphate synthase
MFESRSVISVRLHVNVDHVATLRNARGTRYPDPVRAAEECLAAGAEGITAHLREDRRHIVDDDVERLQRLLSRSGRTFNLEMAATDEMIAIAKRLKPDVCTLVPERREEVTTEGGLDAIAGGPALAARVRELRGAGIRVSLFVAAEPAQIDRSHGIGAAQIELHTGEYAHAGPDDNGEQLRRLATAAKHARAIGLEVAAGHGLTQANLSAVVRLPEIIELNIGHAVVADAIFAGLRETTKAYRAAIADGLRARIAP